MSGSFPYEHSKKQQVRLLGLLMSTAASVVAVGLAFFVARAGYLSYAVARRYGIMVLFLVVLFYGLIRSGLNLRFRDPSLAIPQMVGSGLAATYLVFEGSEARPAFLAVYLMSFLFALFVLDARRLIGVALFYLGCYGTVVWLLSIWRPETTEVRLEVFRFLFFAALMTWFTVLGCSIGRLRGKLERANEELAAALAEAEALSRRDALTGCYNRRHAMEQLELETKRAARGSALSLCLADLDEFKVINDTFGHGAGDEVLKQFVAAATRSLRATDFVARFGGEEFLFVFSQTPAAAGAVVAERIRRAVSDMHIPPLSDENRVTVSIGVAEHRISDPMDQTLSRADEALYRAKREGGNRVVLAS